MIRTCPRCGRGNPAYEPTCFTCGASLGDPADVPGLDADGFAPPPDDVISITPLAFNDDELIDDEEPPPPKAETSPVPPPPPEPPAAEDPLSLALDRVAHAMETLRWSSHLAAEGRQAAADLLAAATAIDQLFSKPEEPAVSPPVAPAPVAPTPTSHPVALPPVRLGYALVIPGLNNPDRAPDLVAALKVDGVTARQLAGSHHVSVAARAATAEPLLASVPRLAAMGVRSAVLSRDELLALPHPILVVSARSGEPLRGVGAGPIWEDEHEQSLAVRGDPLPNVAPVVAVLGEIVVVRARSAFERSRMARAPLGSDLKRLDEHRVGVIDLWARGLHLRLVEGLTRVDLAEGRAPFRAFTESLPQRFSGVRVEARRICRPDERATVNVPGEMIAQTGWPTFDEHTRMVWLFHRPGAG